MVCYFVARCLVDRAIGIEVEVVVVVVGATAAAEAVLVFVAVVDKFAAAAVADVFGTVWDEIDR